MYSNEHLSNPTCVSCGEPLHGKYCSNCGEKVLNEHDKTVSHFFGEFIHMLTHADGKFFKALKLIFLKPGLLTREYLSGRRKLYTSPLTLFIIANLFYFLVPSVDTLNSHYSSQMRGQPYSESIAGVAHKKMEEKKWTEKQMEDHYNAKTRSTSKLLLITFVLLYSLPVALLFYSRQRYYFDHLVFTTELVSFILFVLLLIVPWLLYLILFVLYKAFDIVIPVDINSDAMFTGLLMFIWFYISVAASRVYGSSAWTFARTLLITICIIPVMFLYRFILFYVTMWLL